MRQKPHPYDAEVDAMRCLILHPETIDLCDLEDEDFGSSELRLMYQTAKVMRKEGKLVTPPSLWLELNEQWKDTGFSVSRALFDEWLHAEWASGFLIDTYAEKMKRSRIKRQFVIAVEEGKDAEDFILLAKQAEAKLRTVKITSLAETIEQYLEEWKQKRERMEQKGGVGLITGYKNFDSKISLEPTHLVVLGARSSVGKSAFALNLAWGVTHFDQNVLYFSAEMREGSLIDRLCALSAGVAIEKFKRAETTVLVEAKKELMQIADNLVIEYQPRSTSDDVCLHARKYAAKKKIDLIVVDYLQYLADPTPRGGTNNDRISAITRKFKALAGELNCCLLLLSQVNREAAKNEDGMPLLEHLRDSGSIEQDADLVLMLNRVDRDSQTAEILVAKAREGATGIKLRLGFNPSTTKFHEL